MPSTDQLPAFPEIGGTFALLVLLHFLADWVPQSHADAVAKPSNWRIRAVHCLTYCTPFAILSFLADVGATWTVGCLSVLYVSHFVGDTYYPVFLWAKYVRRPPEMRWKVTRRDGVLYVVGPEQYVGSLPEPRSLDIDSLPASVDPGSATLIRGVVRGELDARQAQRKIDREGFLKFCQDPSGRLLVVTMDQIFHLVFLLPMALVLASPGP